VTYPGEVDRGGAVIGAPPVHVQAEDVSFAYSRRSGPVLHGLSFDVAGRAVGLLGPNGAGKTTLLGVTTGVLSASAGQLRIGDESTGTEDGVRHLQAGLGFLPQQFRVFPGYTVEEFLRYVAWLRRVPGDRLAERVDGALRATDLSDQRGRKVRTLSGGTRQRVGLAQALVNAPSIVLLDEPTVGLDPAQRAALREHLRALRDSTLLLLATHLTEDVAALCDSVVVIDGGRTRFAGTTAQLAARAGHEHVDGASIEAGYLTVIEGSA
jgi:ABC-2 type transport system ATP-binding protein